MTRDIINEPKSGASLQARWQTALGIDSRSTEFITAHGEVVRMLNETVGQVRALPESKRSNYEDSILQWWLLTTAPDLQWTANHTSPLIGPEHIALLGSLGDVIESRLENTSVAPGGLNLTQVREQCDEWLALLEDDGDLPSNLRDMIAEGLRHLMWLIKHADRFGYARVARTAEDLTGQLAVAASQVSPERRGTWTERMKAWGAGLLLFNGLVASTGLAIEQTTDLYKQIEPVVTPVVDLAEGDDEQAS